MTEEELDEWLGSGRTELHDALNKALDIEAGLADAWLPALQKTLVHDLDDVLNLDAGLDNILPAATPSIAPATVSVPEADQSTSTATLSRFADDLSARPPLERLAARVWFPLQELNILRIATHLVIYARDFASVGAKAQDLGSVRGLAYALACDLHRERRQVPRFDRDLDDGFNRAIELADSLTSNVGSATDTHDLHHVNDLTHALVRALASTRDRALTIARDRTTVHGRNYPLAGVLDRALASEVHFDIAFTWAIGRLRTAVTDVTGDNLTEIDLQGVPLEGLRWSDGPAGTQWPAKWENHVRENSTKVGRRLYEIRYGGLKVGTLV